MLFLQIHRAGTPWLISFSVLFLLLIAGVIQSFPTLLIVPLGILVMLNGILVWFFRDPERKTQEQPDALLAPADGKVVECTEFDPVRHSAKMAIYLSLFDVHVNRLPASGVVRDRITQNGRFLPAFARESGEKNASITLSIETPHGSVRIKQIAGMLARRIICEKNKGDRVRQGERYGIIKFGSRVELFTERPVKWQVSPGDRVKAGETLIGKWND